MRRAKFRQIDVHVPAQRFPARLYRPETFSFAGSPERYSVTCYEAFLPADLLPKLCMKLPKLNGVIDHHGERYTTAKSNYAPKLNIGDAFIDDVVRDIRRAEARNLTPDVVLNGHPLTAHIDVVPFDGKALKYLKDIYPAAEFSLTLRAVTVEDMP